MEHLERMEKGTKWEDFCSGEGRYWALLGPQIDQYIYCGSMFVILLLATSTTQYNSCQV